MIPSLYLVVFMLLASILRFTSEKPGIHKCALFSLDCELSELWFAESGRWYILVCSTLAEEQLFWWFRVWDIQVHLFFTVLPNAVIKMFFMNHFSHSLPFFSNTVLSVFWKQNKSFPHVHPWPHTASLICLLRAVCNNNQVQWVRRAFVEERKTLGNSAVFASH